MRFLGQRAGEEEQCTGALVHAGDKRLLAGTALSCSTRPAHIPLPVSRLRCLLVNQRQSSSQYSPTVPYILPLKCCVCGTLAFLGVAFLSSLASPSQGLSRSSSGDSSPPLSKSPSPADTFCPSKKPSPVPAGFASLSSAAVASQPGWQFPASSCPSPPSVGKDRDHHAPGERELAQSPTHVQKNLLPKMWLTNHATERKESCRDPSRSTASPPTPPICNWDAQTWPASAATMAPNHPPSCT